jgi:hypothetical protein
MAISCVPSCDERDTISGRVQSQSGRRETYTYNCGGRVFASEWFDERCALACLTRDDGWSRTGSVRCRGGRERLLDGLTLAARVSFDVAVAAVGFARQMTLPHAAHWTRVPSNFSSDRIQLPAPSDDQRPGTKQGWRNKETTSFRPAFHRGYGVDMPLFPTLEALTTVPVPATNSRHPFVEMHMQTNTTSLAIDR